MKSNNEYDSYSGWFWFSKLLYLAGAVVSALLIWQLWDGFDGEINLSGDDDKTEVVEALDTDGDGREDLKDADDDNDGFSDIAEKNAGTDPLLASSFPSVDADGDGYSDTTEEEEGTDPNDIDDYPELGEDADGDGYTNEEELEAKSDPTASSSTPEADKEPVVAEDTVGYTIDASTTDGAPLVAEPHDTSSCTNEYVIEDGVTMLIHDVDCDVEASASDFVWSHTSTEDGTTLSSSPTAYCVRSGAADDTCSSGNGILEIRSEGGANGVDVEIRATRGYDQNNALEAFEPIINSIKVKG